MKRLQLLNSWKFVLPLPWAMPTFGQFENSLPSLLSLIPTDVSKGKCKALSLHCQKQPVSGLLQKKGGSGKEGSGDNGGEAFPYSQKESVSFCFQQIFFL